MVEVTRRIHKLIKQLDLLTCCESLFENTTHPTHFLQDGRSFFQQAVKLLIASRNRRRITPDLLKNPLFFALQVVLNALAEGVLMALVIG